MPAVRMGGKENDLRRYDARNYRRRGFKGEHAWWSNAVPAIIVETRVLSRPLMVGGNCGAGRHTQLQRVQPDASQQQQRHGKADQPSAPGCRGNAVIALYHESWKSNRCVKQLAPFYTNSARVTNVTDV